MRVVRYDASRRSAWDAFVGASKNGTFLFRRDYMEYHADRFADHSLLVEDGARSEVVALLPAHERDGALVSHGGLTYGGFVTGAAMRVPLMLEVFEATREHLARHGFGRLVYKPVPHVYHALPAEEDRYALFLLRARLTRCGALAVVPREGRAEFQERRRRGARKAREAGLEVRSRGDLGAFHRLLEEVLLARHGARPVHTLAELSLLAGRFPDALVVHGVHEGDALVAAVLVFDCGRVVRAQYIASNERGRELGALDLLFDRLLNDVYRDRPWFDLGTSDEEGGERLNRTLIEQKEGFGARAVTLEQWEVDLATWEPGRLLRAMEGGPHRDG